MWVEKIAPDPSPFGQDIRINNNSLACVIMFHGFSETPFEYKAIAEDIASLGVDVHVPLLPHHGVNSDELAKATCLEAYDWGMQLIREAKTRYKTTIALGQSLGAGIILTSVYRGVIPDAVIVACANAYPSKRVRLMTALAPLLHLSSFKARYTSFRDMDIPPEYITWKKKNFPRMPVSLFVEAMTKASEHVNYAAKVTVPFIGIHGKKDFATNVEKSSLHYYNKANTRTKIAIIVEDAGHSVLLSRYQKEILVYIKDFMQNILRNQKPAEIAERVRIPRHYPKNE